MSVKSALYPFSGDPITNGHLNIIKRALNVFDRIVVGIGVNPLKKYTFTLEERKNLAEKVIHSIGLSELVTVKAFEGLQMDFVYEQGIKTVIRGVRNTPDFSFEKLLHDVNQSQNLGIETCILIADKKYAHVSSSAVKELQKNQGKNIIDYVPMIVKKALEETISGQSIFGITGEIGAGKSYVSEQILRYTLDKSVLEADPITNIDLDAIGHEILLIAKEPIYENTRQEIHDCFEGVFTDDNKIDIKRLGDQIFSDLQSRIRFDMIMREPMYLMLRRKLQQKRGLILINSALLAEADMMEFVNNNIIMVVAPEDIRIKRLQKRGYSEGEITNRMSAQLDAESKKNIIKESIKKYHHGNLIVYNNDETNPDSTPGLIRDIKKAVKYRCSYLSGSTV